MEDGPQGYAPVPCEATGKLPDKQPPRWGYARMAEGKHHDQPARVQDIASVHTEWEANNGPTRNRSENAVVSMGTDRTKEQARVQLALRGNVVRFDGSNGQASAQETQRVAHQDRSPTRPESRDQQRVGQRQPLPLPAVAEHVSMLLGQPNLRRPSHGRHEEDKEVENPRLQLQGWLAVHPVCQGPGQALRDKERLPPVVGVACLPVQDQEAQTTNRARVVLHRRRR